MPASTTYRLSVLVLAGGQSRRMGRDKARLVVQGEPLILRVVRRVKQVADEVLVVSRWPHEYAFTGVACVPDVLPGQGPLAGMWSGALVAAGRYIAPVACDMPFVNPDLLQAMVEVLEAQPHLEGVLPVEEERAHPLHGVYRRQTFLQTGARALRRGKRAIQAALDQMHLDLWTKARWRSWEPEGRAFWNLNTFKDFQRLTSLLKDEETLNK